MKDDQELTALLRTAARAIGDARPDGAAMVSGFRRARRRQGLIGAGAVAAVILLAAAVLPPLLAGDGTVNVAAGDAAGSYGPGWTQLPDPPLSPRTGATAATVGDEIVVAGGTQRFCQPLASCVGRLDPDPGFADGAAFNVATGKWRRIAPAPFGFADAHATVVGDALFLFTCDQISTITLPSQRSICDDRGAKVLRYRTTADAWDFLPAPPSGGPYGLVTSGSTLVAYASGALSSPRPDWKLDHADGTWRELPHDPLPPLADRQVVADGNDLLLFGTDPGWIEGSRPDPWAARFDGATGVWSKLGPVLGSSSQVWALDRLVVLNPEPGSIERGGIFDASSGRSSPMPPPPAAATSLSGALGAASAVFTSADGWVMDLPSRTWMQIPPADARDAAVTSFGRRLFRFGGERYVGTLGGELRGDAWVWTPPSDLASTAPTPSLAPHGDRVAGTDDRPSSTVASQATTAPTTPPTSPMTTPPPPTAAETAPPAAPQLVSASGDSAAGRITVRFSLPVVAGDSPATSCCPAGYLAAMSLIVYGADRACSVPAGNAHEYLSGMGTDTITTDASSLVAGTTYISIGSGFVKSATGGAPNAPVACIPVSVKG